MTDFVRVRDDVTGHEYSVRAGRVKPGQTIIDKPAVTRAGRAVPAKPKRTIVAEPAQPLATLAKGDDKKKEQ